MYFSPISVTSLDNPQAREHEWFQFGTCSLSEVLGEWGGWASLVLFKLCDTAHRTNAGAYATPVGGVVVGAGPQDVLPSTVVRVLVEDPVALHHIAGGDAAHLELVLQVGAVLTQLHHLTRKVVPLKEFQAVGAIVLLSM